jgi:hypothetical protein
MGVSAEKGSVSKRLGRLAQRRVGQAFVRRDYRVPEAPGRVPRPGTPLPSEAPGRPPHKALYNQDRRISQVFTNCVSPT